MCCLWELRFDFFGIGVVEWGLKKFRVGGSSGFEEVSGFQKRFQRMVYGFIGLEVYGLEIAFSFPKVAR